MQSKNKKLVAGILTLILGLIGNVYAIITMHIGRESEFGYRYRFPFTLHEIITVAILVISIALFIAGAVLLLTLIPKSDRRNSTANIRILIECAVMIAVAVVLSIYTKIWKAPLGGSVTLFSMVPLIIIGLRHGVLWGYAGAFVYSALYWLFYGIGQIVGISTYVFVVSSLVDYILAYTLIGTIGFFKIFIDKSETRRKKIAFTLTGTLLVCVLRYIAHVIVGAVVWYEITKAGDWNEYVHTVGMWLYSTVYNMQYMLPETIITLVAAPAVVTILAAVGNQKKKYI